jgi:hypothetical protein
MFYKIILSKQIGDHTGAKPLLEVNTHTDSGVNQITHGSEYIFLALGAVWRKSVNIGSLALKESPGHPTQSQMELVGTRPDTHCCDPAMKVAPLLLWRHDNCVLVFAVHISVNIDIQISAVEPNNHMHENNLVHIVEVNFHRLNVGSHTYINNDEFVWTDHRRGSVGAQGIFESFWIETINN